MKTATSLLVAALAFSASLAAQQKSQEEFIQLRDEKLAKEVFKKAPWGFDYDAARKQAKAEGKLILAYFTRSYAG